MRERLIAVVTLGLITPGALLMCVQATERPLGLIVSAKDSRILSQRRPEMKASDGDLLFAGDRLRTRKESAEFVVCFEGKAPVRHLLSPGGDVTLARDRVHDSGKKLRTPGGNPPVCRLPEVEPEPDISAKDASDLSARVSDPGRYAQRVAGAGDATSRQGLATLDAAIRSDPHDMVAATARAAALEEAGLAAEAADQYAEIANVWPNQQWAKVLAHDNRTEAADRPGSGTTYAVVIGISNYKDPEIPPLRFAHLDAKRFAEYLSEARGHSVPAAQVQLLINEAATLSEIRNSIQRMTDKAGKSDTFLLFISSHGSVSEKGPYLITHNASWNTIKDTAYSMEAVADLMYRTRAKVGRFVLFVDACHAGTIGEIREKNTISGSVAGAVKNGNNTLALLASKPEEVAYEHSNFGVGEGHSAFTYFLLRGLAAEGVNEADADGDGRVSLGELSQYVINRVVDSTWRSQHPFDVSNIRDAEQVELANLRDKGILLPPFKTIPKQEIKRKSAAPGAAEDVPPPAAPPESDADTRRLIELEEQGQQTLLRYLEGDEVPQERTDFVNARDRYEEALKIAPGSLYLESRKYFFEGRVLIFDKKYEEAIAHIETAIRLNPRSPSPYNALGIAYLEMGRYAEAIDALEAAIARAWYWPYPRHNLALALMELGRYEPAMAAYRKAMVLTPQRSYLPYNLGLILQKTNRRREAEDAYTEAKRIAEQNARRSRQGPTAEARAERIAMPLIALGLLKAHDGRTAEAVRDYNDALATLAPYPANRNILIVRHNLSLLLAIRKETKADAEELLTANIAAGYPPSRQRMAEWLAEQGRAADSVPHFEALLADRPDYTAARLALAQQLGKLGETVREREQLFLAREKTPANVTVLMALAEFESRQKQWTAAHEAYRAALAGAVDPKLRRNIQAALKRLP